MGEQEIGHVGGLQPVLGEAVDDELPHRERAGIDESYPALSAQQHHGAPAEAAVADALARKALHQNVDVPALDAHRRPPQAPDSGCNLDDGRPFEPETTRATGSLV